MFLEDMISDEMLAELVGSSVAEVMAFLQSLGLEWEVDEQGDLEVHDTHGSDWRFSFDIDDLFIFVEDFSYED